MPLVLVALATLLWIQLGHPRADVANLVWGDDAAPWETVDARLHPRAAPGTVLRVQPGLPSLAACRAWAEQQAGRDQAPDAVAYSCGVGRLSGAGEQAAYRRLVRPPA